MVKLYFYFIKVVFFYITFGTIKIYSMYTFINQHFCASIAHLGTWRGKKPNLGLP